MVARDLVHDDSGFGQQWWSYTQNKKLTKIWSKMLAENMKASPARLNINAKDLMVSQTARNYNIC